MTITDYNDVTRVDRPGYAYCEPVAVDGTTNLNAALARLLAATLGDLGDGIVSNEGETNGQLDGIVNVRFGVVISGNYAVTMDELGTATVWVDAERAPIQQLRSLLEALEEHCISPYTLLR